jgi:tRNA pseudouridine38-40 synthase
MKKYRLLLSYDGTDFEGWQRQIDGKATIQGAVEKAVAQICNEHINIVGSGRTDSGVHAEGQVAHFKTSKELGPNFIRSMNSLLPDTVSLLKVYEAPDEFHAQISAISKTYRYLIHNSEIPNALRRRFTTWQRKPLSIENLNAICEPLMGEHDFKSFQTTGTDVKTSIRTITEAHWGLIEPELIEFRISGTGFLKQMVRNIVGTAIYLHQNGQGPLEMSAILKELDRQAAKTTAPPTGLYLHRVVYPTELDNNCREL